MIPSTSFLHQFVIIGVFSATVMMIMMESLAFASASSNVAADITERKLDATFSLPQTSAPTLRPTEHPTVAPTRTPTLRPTEHPTVAPTRTPTPRPTEHPTVAPTRTPTLRPTQHPTVAPTRECPDGGVIVKNIIGGVTEFPTTPTLPITIIDVDNESTVTVALHQFWDSSSSVGHIFASYKKSLYDQVCIEDKDVPGGSMVFDNPITIQCNVMTPYAFLEICVADDLANGILAAEDNAEVPKCCHPEIPEENGTVCYELLIECSLECVV